MTSVFRWVSEQDVCVNGWMNKWMYTCRHRHINFARLKVRGQLPGSRFSPSTLFGRQGLSNNSCPCSVCRSSYPILPSSPFSLTIELDLGLQRVTAFDFFYGFQGSNSGHLGFSTEAFIHELSHCASAPVITILSSTGKETDTQRC